MTLKRRPDGVWTMRLYTAGTKKGPRVYKTLGKIPESEAKDLYRAELAKVARRRGRGGAKLTVKDLADEWTSSHGPELSPAWLKTASGMLKNHLLPAFGSRMPETLRKIDVTHYRAQREKDDVKPATINREIAVLRGILAYAVAQELLDTHPLPTGTARPAREEHRLVYFEREEWDLLRTAFDDPTRWEAHFAKVRRLGPVRVDPIAGTERRHGGGRRPDSEASHQYRERLRAVIPLWHLLLLTGSRLGEGIGLTWQDVDFRRGIVRIPTGKTARHGRSVKTLPLGPDLRSLLKGLSEGKPGGPVFQRPSGGAWDPAVVRQIFELAKKLARIRKELVLHSLRHTAASWLVIAGTPLKTVAEILGHSSIRTTERYAHLAPGHLTDAIQTLGALTRETPRKTSAAPIERQSSSADGGEEVR